MKKVSVLSFLLLISLFGLSQSWKSSNMISGTDDIVAIKSIIGPDNSIITLGHFKGTINIGSGISFDSYGGRDYFIAKASSVGEIVWARQVGSSINDYVGGGLSIDSQGNIYVSGGFQNYLKYTVSDSILSTGGFDAFLLKYNSDGGVLFCNNIGAGLGNQRPNSLGMNNDELYISGFFSDSIELDLNNTLYSNNSFDDYFYAKVNPTDGSIIWVKQLEALTSSLSGRIFDFGFGTDFISLIGVFAGSVRINNDTIISQDESQDIHIIKTDNNGDAIWTRLIKGSTWEYVYTGVVDSEDNIYIAGYYNSPILTIDINDSETSILDENNGDYDYIISKFASNGDLLWANSSGGIGSDKLSDSKLFNDEYSVSGEYADTLFWGGIRLETNGIVDKDMFVGSLDLEGNYRSANGFGGTNNSSESCRSIFNDGTNFYNIIRSNSELLVLGDSIYTSTTGKYYLALGIIGCLPISVDNTIPSNITGCYGDSTGSIQVVASGGFGAPWQYSVDNGDTYSDVAFYQDLPAGDYQVVVIDAENCTEVGPLITLTQPDSLEAILVSSDDIFHHTDWLGEVTVTDGSAVVTATGGTSPYTFQLMPGGTPQALGTYYFPYEDSGKYVVLIEDLNNCGPASTDTIEINVEYSDATGIDDYSGAEVKIYPNPTSGIVTIEMPFEGRKCKMEVVNMNGQTVLKRKIFPSGGIITETLDLSNQAKGLYMIRINGEALQSAIMVK